MNKVPSLAELVRRAHVHSRRADKLGRNQKCWCGSGKKYKRCHWAEDREGGGVAHQHGKLSDLIETLITPYLDGDTSESEFLALVDLAVAAFNCRAMTPDEAAAHFTRHALSGLDASEIGVEAALDTFMDRGSVLAGMYAIARHCARDDPRTIVSVSAVPSRNGRRMDLTVASIRT